MTTREGFAADSSYDIETFDVNFIYQVEATVILSCIDDVSKAYDISKFLEAKHFTNDVWGKVWGIIEQKIASEKASQINIATVQLDLQSLKIDTNLTDYLGLITEDLDLVRSYAVKIKELYLNRYFKTELSALQDSSDLESSVTRLKDIANSIENELVDVTISKHIGELTDDLLDYLAEEGLPEVFTFGLPNGIDENIVDLSPGNTTIVAATPGGGKTSLGIYMAVKNAMKGDPVHVFSLEMSEHQIVARFLNVLTQIPSKDILLKKVTKEQIKKLKAAKALVDKLPIHITPYPDLPLSTLLQSMRDSRIKHNTKLFIVDYAQLIDYHGQKSTRENMSYISQKLKSVALELDTAIVIMSQLSRHNDIEPSMFMLKESSDLEQSASLVVLLYPDKLGFFDKYKTEEEYPIFFKVDKQRNGEKFKRLLLFNPSKMDFKVISNADLAAFDKKKGSSSETKKTNKEDDDF